MRFKVLFVAAMLAPVAVGSGAAETAKPATARIERAAAEKIALARVPDGRITEGELEQEHGRWLWSFDVAQPGSRNIVEVQVDATSGRIVSQEKETPADEAKEAAKERTNMPKTP